MTCHCNFVHYPLNAGGGSAVYTAMWFRFSHHSPLLFQTQAAGFHGVNVECEKVVKGREWGRGELAEIY